MSMPGFDSGQFAQEGQDRAEAQKKALMGVIAEHGAAGAQAYAQSQGQVNANAQTSAVSAADRMKGSAVEGSGAFANDSNARQQAITNLYTQDLQHGRESLANDMSRMSASNANYQDQIGQAMPMVAQNIAGQFQAAQQRIAAEEKRREDERRMQEMQMQAQQEQLNAAREDRAARTANGGDNRTDDEKRMDALKIQAAERELGAPDPKAEENAISRRLNAVTLSASQQLGGPGTNGSSALGDILNGMSLADAQKKWHTPRGHTLNWSLIQKLAGDITSAKLGG